LRKADIFLWCAKIYYGIVHLEVNPRDVLTKEALETDLISKPSGRLEIPASTFAGLSHARHAFWLSASSFFSPRISAPYRTRSFVLLPPSTCNAVRGRRYATGSDWHHQHL